MRSSSQKQAKASSLQGHSKVQSGVGKSWKFEENGDKVQLQSGRRERKIQTVEPPKKKTSPHDVGPSRRAHAKETKSQEIVIPIQKSTFLDFTNGKSHLNREELEKYVNAYTSSNAEEHLQGRDFDWILASADTNGDACIDFSELPHVQAAINSYLETSKIIKKIFTKHDKNGDGVLEHKELQNLLTKLNDSVPVPDNEVEWVMKIAATAVKGQVTKDELLHAINYWYNYIEDIEVELPKDHHKGGIIGRAMTALHQSKKGKVLKSFLSTVAAPARPTFLLIEDTGPTQAIGGKVSKPISQKEDTGPAQASGGKVSKSLSPSKSASPPAHRKSTRAMGA